MVTFSHDTAESQTIIELFSHPYVTCSQLNLFLQPISLIIHPPSCLFTDTL